MSRKSKGISAERELIHLFWKNNWAAIRVAGSGSMKYPSPDILAGNNLRRLAVECKSIGGDSVYIPKEDILDLKKFSVLFGAEPWIGVRFNKEGWYFITLEDLHETETSYSASLSNVKMKGLLFEELIGGVQLSRDTPSGAPQ